MISGATGALAMVMVNLVVRHGAEYLWKVLHLRRLSPDCLELLDHAKEMVEVNAYEDLRHHFGDNKLPWGAARLLVLPACLRLQAGTVSWAAVLAAMAAKVRRNHGSSARWRHALRSGRRGRSGSSLRAEAAAR